MKVARTVLNGGSGSNAADLHNPFITGQCLLDMVKCIGLDILNVKKSPTVIRNG